MTLSIESFAGRWLAIALVYLVGAVALGIFMAASHDYALAGLHVHLNLLGWVSMALFGIIYRLFPRVAASRLATLHFWGYQLALPVMMLGLSQILLGRTAWEPVVGVGSVAVGLSILCFAFAVWRGTRQSALDVVQLEPAA